MISEIEIKAAQAVQAIFVCTWLLLLSSFLSIAVFGFQVPPMVQMGITLAGIAMCIGLVFSLHLMSSESIYGDLPEEHRKQLRLRAVLAFIWLALPTIAAHLDWAVPLLPPSYAPLAATALQAAAGLAALGVVMVAVVWRGTPILWKNPPLATFPTAAPQVLMQGILLATGCYRYLEWDVWKEMVPTSRWKLFQGGSEQRGRRLKAAYYSEILWLQEFQRSITCPYVDAHCIAPELPETLRRRDGICVLDIGGYDGQFTANLLREMRRLNGGEALTIRKVCCIDPVATSETKSKYQEAMAAQSIDAGRVETMPNRFESQKLPDGEWDLVIASHSLYEVMEKEEDTFIADCLKSLREKAGARGTVLITLGSDKGASYHFRKQALAQLGLDLAVPSNSIKYSRHKGFSGFREFTIDNVMRMDGIVGEFERGDLGPLINWLSYFLRIDAKMLSPAHIRQLYRLLESFLIQAQQLSEFEKRVYAEMNEGLREDELVLPHKVVCFMTDKPKAAARNRGPAIARSV